VALGKLLAEAGLGTAVGVGAGGGVGAGAPRLGLVAATLRHLVLLAEEDGRKLEVFREAADVLGSLAVPAGGAPYPADEAAWLVASCWNRGLWLQQYGRAQMGTAYMKVRGLPASPAPRPASPAPLNYVRIARDVHVGAR
jgi:hypothetical protein